MQAAAFSMGLQDALFLVGCDLASVKQRIEGIAEGPLTVSTAEALTNFTRLAVFEGFGVVAEGEFHFRRDT